MQVRFLLGPAGSGKTWRCLNGVKEALKSSTEGLPLLFVAPKQATFQLERQLLADAELAGYSRLHILSFERLARFVLERLGAPLPRLLNDEGRIMVLRAILRRRREELSIFHAAARMHGFARHLSDLLREFEQHQLGPEQLREAAARVAANDHLSRKLADLALIVGHYRDWLGKRALEDSECLLGAATEALEASAKSGACPLKIGALWMDGFAEMTPQEMNLLQAVLARSGESTLALCLEQEPREDVSWLSTWSLLGQAYRQWRNRLQSLEAHVAAEVLPRREDVSRFQDNPVLRHLEAAWTCPEPFAHGAIVAPTPAAVVPMATPPQSAIGRLISPVKRRSRRKVESDAQMFLTLPDEPIAEPETEPALPESDEAAAIPSREAATAVAATIRLVACRSTEEEAVIAAREILTFVRSGGRYRDCSVLVRSLGDCHDVLRRVFRRFEIPSFVDRREPVSHHPLTELTRGAIWLAVNRWSHDDWFSVLKSGLVRAEEAEIDLLENEALARGWRGEVWRRPIQVPGDDLLRDRLETLRAAIVPPFVEFVDALAGHQRRPTAGQLTRALQKLWASLEIEETLDDWNRAADAPIHETVWVALNEWLSNVERAFAEEPLALEEWLPVLDAGLSNLTVGVIPPRLDQVLIGAVDRSRNPDLRLCVLVGMNETVFPAPPAAHTILTEADRETLSRHDVALGLSQRQQIGRERFLGYIACTRPRERLVLTWSRQDEGGKELNPSPFVSHLQRLFPTLEPEIIQGPPSWQAAVHATELVPNFLRQRLHGDGPDALHPEAILPPETGGPLLASLDRLHLVSETEAVSPELARLLYGPILRTSVSRVEQFGECPFRFFVNAGLRAEERTKFEVDQRERGSFQHEVLEKFHGQLESEGKRWRDVTPAEARERLGAIAEEIAHQYREGLFADTHKSAFTARSLTEHLKNFIETVIGWMDHYRLDPRVVELDFGGSGSTVAPWELDLGIGARLAFRGKIDRIDVAVNPATGEGICVVMDYKSSARKLDPLKLENGIQIQLPAYLAALCGIPEAPAALGVKSILPAGVFYLNLKGNFGAAETRDDALAETAEARRGAYKHYGRFSVNYAGQLDSRYGPEGKASGQFDLRINKDGSPRKKADVVTHPEFISLLDEARGQLVRMGREIYDGKTVVDPYKKGSWTACTFCDYKPVCRIDPWSHVWRTLKAKSGDEEDDE